MPRSQLKLMGVLGGLVLLVVAVTGVVVERGLRRDHVERVERSLRERAALVGELTRGIPFARAHRAELDAVADRAGRAADARVTLIAPDGVVHGDSNVPLDRLDQLSNHATREEIAAALRGEVGRSTRRSDTVGRELLYLATPAVAEGAGVVRVAVDLSSLGAEIAALRRELVFAGTVGLLAALALSYVISWLTLRPLREMRRVAASIAEGHLQDRLPSRGRDELSEIAGAINQIAAQLRLRLEDATREKEQLLAVLDGMVEGVLVVDAKGVVVLANARLRELYALSGELPGRPVLEAIRDAELDQVLHEVRRTGGVVSRAIAIGRGTPRHVQVHAARFPAEGPHAGCVAVLHDITELMRLEEVRRDFVANASHELRTPISAIRGFAETLLGGDALTEEARRSYLEVIERHTKRLGSLVEDLLELSRIEGGKATLDPTAVDVREVIEGLIRDLRPRFEERQLAVHTSSQGDPVARADPRALEQILTNLLDNAIKYSDPGDRIEVEVIGEPSQVQVCVSDTGIGMTGVDLARIFERFYRVDKSRSRALGGTGLGLSIVKHLVQRSGGEICVTSEPGQGSIFRFTLPRPPQEGV